MTMGGALRIRRPRGLWVARELPFPLNSGDRIYSAHLLRALAEAGSDLTVVGLSPVGNATPPDDWPVRWLTVLGGRRSTASAICSRMPLVAARHATPGYRELVDVLAREEWDFVIADQYGTGWTIPRFSKIVDGNKRPVLVHIAHDHEGSVTESLYREFRGSWVTRIGLWQNCLKARAFERRLVASVDLVTAIADEDAARFAVDFPGVRTLVLTPGFAGKVSTRERLDGSVPRRVVMVGSYHWVAKQENLRRFVGVADSVFAQNGIELHVIGEIPEALRNEFRLKCSACVFRGFVEDIQAQFAAARIAVVPEVIGGGFKLKLLDYIFGRVPVATLQDAAAGIPEDIRRAMLCSQTLEGLVSLIVRTIDQVEELDQMQCKALDAARARFHWHDRGAALLQAISAQSMELGQRHSHTVGERVARAD